MNDFLDHSEGKGNSTQWVNAQRLYLVTWARDLYGVDLKSANLRDHIAPALDKHTTARKFRIETLKGFYAWLRKTRHELTSAQDPTLDLPVPQGTPEKHVRRKIVPLAHVQATRPHMDERTRDSVDLILATAWHYTELARFAKNGIIEERPKNALASTWSLDAAAVLSVKQKTGGVERWSVSPAALEAARRIQASSAPSERWLNRCIEAACHAASAAARARDPKAEPIPVYTYGPLRHSVLTWARERGASFDDISKNLAHHKDPRTTQRFYLDVAVPARLPTEI